MNKFIIQKNSAEKVDREFILIGVQTLSTGDGLELSQRFGYDASKRPQSLTFRRKNTALTATMRLVFDVNECTKNNVNLFDYISDICDTTGRRVEVVFNDNNLGLFVVESVQIAGNCDATSAFNTINASISLTEAYVSREIITSGVSTL